MMNERLTFAYWNTGLSPTQGKNDERYTRKMLIAVQTIEALVGDGVDFLAVSEVNAVDVARLGSVLEHYDYLHRDGTQKVGRTRFDTGIFYNAQKIDIDINEPIFLDAKFANQTMKIAVRVNIRPEFGVPIRLLITHWPSRLHDNRDERNELGFHLRKEIDSYLENQGNYVIAMGDFNDEPFDKSISTALGATRDRKALHKSLLYNPFWRHLGERFALNLQNFNS